MTQMAARKKSTGKHKADEILIPDKLYFRIGEVATLCRLPAYVLRFWESEFPQLKPVKSSTGQRMYRKRDVESVLRIKQLLYEQGFTISGARQQLRAETKSDKTQTAIPFPTQSVPRFSTSARACARFSICFRRAGLDRLVCTAYASTQFASLQNRRRLVSLSRAPVASLRAVLSTTSTGPSTAGIMREMNPDSCLNSCRSARICSLTLTSTFRNWCSMAQSAEL